LTKKCGFRLNQQRKSHTLVYLLCECNGTPPAKPSDINPDVKPRKVRVLDLRVQALTLQCSPALT
jgi:hypothetical protein